MDSNPQPLRAAAIAALRSAPSWDLADPTPIVVWADQLMARGDPRGELILLQLEPSSPERIGRITALLRSERDALLGEAAAMVTDVAFVRGFLHSATLSYALDRRPPVFETLQALQCRRGARAHADNQHALLLSPLLGDLRRITGPIEVRTFIGLATGDPRPLTHLDLPRALLQPTARWSEALDAALDDLSGLPALRSLRCTHVAPLRTWNTLLRAFPRVERLDLHGPLQGLYGLLRLRPSVRVTLTGGTVVVTLENGILTIESKLGRIYDQARSLTLAGLVIQLLEAFPAQSLTEVRLSFPAVRYNRGEQARMKAAIERVTAPAST